MMDGRFEIDSLGCNVSSAGNGGTGMSRADTQPIQDTADSSSLIPRPSSPIRCVTLLSGGLDSMLAVRIMQEHGVEVEALNFKTIFTCCQDQSGHAAHELGVRLTVVSQEDDYLDLVKYPVFGYGKGANPCVDCRIYMFQRAKRFMEQIGAQFIVSGEIVGQRPMSQKRRDLEVISFHSQLEDLLLRPLSAKLLPPTLPEREGWVDRERLYAIRGRSRKELIELAAKYKLKSVPTPSSGCALTEQQFSLKVHDLINFDPGSQRWDFEMLKLGRHFRLNSTTKVIVGRREVENEQMEYMYRLPESRASAMLHPVNFTGPRTLVLGELTDEALEYAVGLLMRFSKHYDPDNAQIRLDQGDDFRTILGKPNSLANDARNLAVAD
jgi:tRNA U34 2-thiouridine synthase MnmA/TrmU